MHLSENFFKHTLFAALTVLISFSFTLDVLAAGVPPTDSTTDISNYEIEYGYNDGPILRVTSDDNLQAPYTKSAQLDAAYIDNGQIFLLSRGEITDSMDMSDPNRAFAVYVYTRPNDTGFFVALNSAIDGEGLRYYRAEEGGASQISSIVFAENATDSSISLSDFHPDADTDPPATPGGSSGSVNVTATITGIPDSASSGYVVTLLNSDGAVVDSRNITMEPTDGTGTFSLTFQNIPPGGGYTVTVSDGNSNIRAVSAAFSVEAGPNPPVEINQAYDESGGAGAGGTVEQPPTCESESSGVLGWILCPVLRGTYNVLEGLFVGGDTDGDGQPDGGGFMGALLDFDVAEDETGAAAMRAIWSGFRVLANLFFIIAFLVIIYSAASGNMMSAYDVKRLLPRLVLVAIGVQLSFFLVTETINIFNDIGRGIGGLILAPLNGADGFAVTGFQSVLPGSQDEVESITGVFQNVANGTLDGIIGVIAVPLILILGIVLLLLSIGGILLMAAIFIIRNIALTVMVVIAPVAFVAALLPNTEKFFKSYWNWFINLLMLYPIAIAFIAAGKLVGSIWLAADASPDLFTSVVATVATFAPFFVAPKLLSMAGGAVRQIANGVENAKNRASQTEFAQRAKKRAKGAAYNAADKAGRYKAPEGTTNRFQKALEKASQKGVGSITGTKTYSRLSARASEDVSKLDSEDAGAARIKLLEGETDRRAEATKQAVADAKNDGLTEGSAEYNMKINTAADEASVEYLTGVLKDQNTSDFDKRAAANILGVKFSHDEEAVGALREVVQGGRAGNAKEQRLAAQIVEDNASVYMPGLGHLLKGDGFVTVGVEATNLSSGSVKDIGERADAKHVAALSDQFLTQASNPSTRNQTDLSKVAAIAEKMRKRAGTDRDDKERSIESGMKRMEGLFEFRDKDGNIIADWKAENAPQIKQATFKPEADRRPPQQNQPPTNPAPQDVSGQST